MFPATVKVFYSPALTVNVSPTMAWWFELNVFSMPTCCPLSSKRTIPEKAASLAKPVLSTVIPVTVTSCAPAVKVTLVKGSLAALPTAKVAAGCVADVIVKPSPVAATELADEATDEATDEADEAELTVVAIKLSYLARDIEPKYPTAGATPLADCQEAAAALVSEPKYPVALTERCPAPFK